MAVNRDVKSRKRNTNTDKVLKDKREAKTSLIDKVTTEDKEPTSSRIRTKTSLASKVNQTTNTEKVVVPKEEVKKEVKKEEKKEVKKVEKPKKVKKERTGRFANSFFFKLSVIGRLTLVIIVVGIIFLGVLTAMSVMRKGEPVLGSRAEPVIVISAEDVKKVDEAIRAAVPEAEAITVDYNAYRLVVVADLADSTTAEDGKVINGKIYKTINGILPIDKYFSSKDVLNNDLYIYSTDIVPKDYETNSKYIYQTYKNSRMSKALSYNLLTPRDKKSAQEVLETMEKAGN